MIDAQIIYHFFLFHLSSG